MNENNVKNIKMGRHCQGVLNLCDNYETNGGFQFVPGGYELTKDWFEENRHRLEPANPNGRYFFDKRNWQFAVPQRLPCPAGTLIIFDAALPHGTKPNETANNRIVQFLRFVPKSIFTEKTLKRRQALIKRLCKENNVKLDETEVV